MQLCGDFSRKICSFGVWLGIGANTNAQNPPHRTTEGYLAPDRHCCVRLVA